MSCQPQPDKQSTGDTSLSLQVEIVETSAAGNNMQEIFPQKEEVEAAIPINLHPEEVFQTITGIGGSFTEASAHLLNQLGPENRQAVLEAYFGDEGARYSLTRTHINSCDFSLGNYSYAPEADDKELAHFTIEEDRPDLIPMIKSAQEISSDGFKIIASPWTAPPWMKDNKDWKGGKLLPEYYGTWAHFFSKYLDAYRAEGIEIWGITVENEPLGNANNWESMHFTAEEMTAFVRDHLGPRMKSDKQQVKILGYDQNRDELKHWVDVMYGDAEAAQYFDGTAIHWYASTVEWFPEVLQYAHQKAPDKHLIESEGCIDAEVPKWQDDAWYWSPEATDWGWDWASPETKHLHPKYVPVFRYARDIIGCLNNWVDGWVDWNMVLDRQGGPNWFGNWCVAPVIVDPEADEVYFTPLYYTMAHFSKFIRPGAKRIGFEHSGKDIMVTAVQNPDGAIAVVIFNPTENARHISLSLTDKTTHFPISAKAIQTILIPNA
ncbi:MAG: glycoside hydrolase family 30 protein [Bacteroidota bacterium]